ncbi:uncharacterized protein KY384_002292 [Bacidia gigantensis]|uniref:uncharacterized protein n=1 Tax=Bacidia gigantensis TaxID=2732470 RepID=UPI001D055725|nr:uncharacterized protein KY384_002292 [Bacidia gigantensis]KAG8533506.1 hypothetical protein KY384_002292 [Bacidia gigantensis]
MVQWIVITSQQNGVSIATIGTLLVALQRAFDSDHVSAFSWLAASFAFTGLVQTYQLTPKMPYKLRAAYITGGIMGAVFLFRQMQLRHYNPQRLWLTRLFQSDIHPIELMIEEANRNFTAMIASQSKTIPQAIAEYERRYHMPPPPGFEQWFHMAVESNSPIVDNFDTIMQSLEPFWGITAKEMRARVQDMRGINRQGFFSIKNHSVTMPENTLVLGGFDTTITGWIERFKDILPDMDLVINGLAEPRVIVPNDRLEHLVQTCPSEGEQTLSSSPSQARLKLEWQDLARQENWQMGVRSCPQDSTSRSTTFLPTNHTLTLPFISNHTASKDWCNEPSASYSHSMFIAPYSLKFTNTLVPVFSHGKPSSAQDILYPSPDYSTSIPGAGAKYYESMDPTWDSKVTQLYWAGSDTGGYAASPLEWQKFQRQRFVAAVTNASQPITLLHDSKPSPLSPHSWQPYRSTIANLTSLINVHFTSFNLCASKICEEEMAALPSAPRDSPAEMYKYRFLFDVDGMGRTERFYRLLGSRSLVFKQTMYREWHDDRLVPWVHYVPVSLGMEELPELVRFFGRDERGVELGRRIARQGRQWHGRALRDVDLELGMGRVLVEYARLMGDERDRARVCPWGRRMG